MFGKKIGFPRSIWHFPRQPVLHPKGRVRALAAMARFAALAQSFQVQSMTAVATAADQIKALIRRNPATDNQQNPAPVQHSFLHFPTRLSQLRHQSKGRLMKITAAPLLLSLNTPGFGAAPRSYFAAPNHRLNQASTPPLAAPALSDTSAAFASTASHFSSIFSSAGSILRRLNRCTNR